MMLVLVGLACSPGGDDSGRVVDSAAPAPATADAGPDVVVQVGQATTLDGSGSAGVAFLWDFGDGAQDEVSDPVVTHSWDGVGTYTAVLQVTGEDGGKRTDSATVLVHPELADPPPTWSSSVALGPDGSVYFAVSEAGQVSRCSADLSACTRVEVCSGARQVAVGSDHLAVDCPGGDKVVLLDLDLGLLSEHELGVGAAPYGVVVRGDTTWVSLQGKGQVARLEGTDAGALAAVVDVGRDPRAMALAPDGTLYVSRWRSPPEGAQIYVVRDDAWVATLGLAPDESPDSDTTTRGVPNLLDGLSLSPDGGTLYVPALHANIFRGSYRDGQPLSHDKAVRAVLSALTLDEDGTGVLAEDRKQFDERGRSHSAVPSPLGDRLYVLHNGAEAITIVDAWTQDVRGAVLDIGHFGNGLAVSPDGTTLYVHAWLSRELRAYDLASGGSAPPLVATASTVDSEPMDETDLWGKILFATSADTAITAKGYIACAHCHPEGHDDGQVWDFSDRGEGLRNTHSLLGVGTGQATADSRLGLRTGRLHWSGNFDEAQDFEGDLRNHFGGTGLLSDEDWAATADPLGESKLGLDDDLDALARYMHSLSFIPRSPHEAPEGGAAAFEAAGCGSCHPAPEYTDSSITTPVRHDVGTLTEASGGRLGGELDGLDTPTLLGCWETAPYLHDGSAWTIEEAIVAHTAHADIDEETLALIAGFVRSL